MLIKVIITPRRIESHRFVKNHRRIQISFSFLYGKMRREENDERKTIWYWSRSGRSGHDDIEGGCPDPDGRLYLPSPEPERKM
jgi:hypothetical protein